LNERAPKMLGLNILLLVSLLHTATEGRNFYTILDIPNGSNSQRQIKKAFRKQSLLYHPDKCSEDEAVCQEKMTDVNAAYEVLSDQEKKQVYDQYGYDEERYKEWEKRNSGGGGFDPFADFFGRGRREEGEPKAPDTRIVLDVDLRMLYVGHFIEIKFFRDVLCPLVDECEISDSGCARAGIRKVTRRIGPGFVQQMEESDARCVARGKRYKESCHACPDGPTVVNSIPVSVDIDPGMVHGEEIRFEEFGDERIGHTPGDLIVVLRQNSHQHFSREGDDLHLRLSIPLIDALVGFKTEIPHVDDHPIVISSDNVIDCPTVRTFRNEGMPTKNGRFGDLIVTFDINFPRGPFNEKQKGALRKILK